MFNVAADGVLLLSQAIRRAGPGRRCPVPEPAVGPGRAGARRGARLVDFSPEQLRLLDFGRVVDTTRLRTEFGFTPRWTTVQAFDDFVRGRALPPASIVRVDAGCRRSSGGQPRRAAAARSKAG